MKDLDFRIIHPMTKLHAQAALRGTDAEVDVMPETRRSFRHGIGSRRLGFFFFLLFLKD